MSTEQITTQVKSTQQQQDSERSQNNENENINENEKKHSSLGKFGSKLKGIFSHSDNNESKDRQIVEGESQPQNHRVNKSNGEHDNQSEIKQQSSSGLNTSTSTSTAKMMGGDMTTRNLKFLEKLTKKENRHSIGLATQQTNKSTNNKNNSEERIKRKSIEPNLQQQEYQRKIKMQKIKEEEKKLINKQTIEKIHEDIPTTKTIKNEKRFVAEQEKKGEENILNKIKSMDIQNNKNTENSLPIQQQQINKNEILEHNENIEKKITEKTSQSSTGERKKITYRLDNEKFVVYDYYQITKVLGQGAYAVVAEAIDKRNGQKVAIKKNKTVFSSLSDAKRILREIKLLLHFEHENVISLIGVIPPELHEREDFEEVYLIMPRMETTLSRVIRSKQALTERHKQYFIHQLLSGLSYIHSAGVLHRDLKPENILINGGDCKLKITDFGLSRGVLKEDNSDNDPNNNGNNQQKLTEYVVTRWYRAPEIMCSSRQYDEGVDVWSVGCIMAELFLRKPFFPGGNHIEQLKLIFHYLGVPDDLEWIKTPDAKQWILQMPKKAPKNFQQIMPNATNIAIDLMLSMLIIDPRRRVSVQDALNHTWLKGLKQNDNKDNNNDNNKCEKFDLSFEFEASINTVFGVRHIMYEELKQFQKNRLKKLSDRKAKKQIANGENKAIIINK